MKTKSIKIWRYFMGYTIAQKIIKEHLLSGEMVVGNDIGIKIDQTFGFISRVSNFKLSASELSNVGQKSLLNR